MKRSPFRHCLGFLLTMEMASMPIPKCLGDETPAKRVVPKDATDIEIVRDFDFGERETRSPQVLPRVEQVPQGLPEWYKIKADVAAAATAKKGIFELAKEAVASPATDGTTALFKLRVFMEAGCNKEAIEELKELKGFYPSYPIDSIYSNVRELKVSWDVAKAILDIFPESIKGAHLGELTRHLLDSGWTVEKVDEWLAAKPAGIQNFWIGSRLRFLAEHQGSEVLEKELADAVKAHPKDIRKAIELLEVLAYTGKQYGGRQTGGKPLTDLSWLADTIKPEWTTDAVELARLCVPLREQKNAIAYYRMAVTIPLSRTEIARDVWQQPVSTAYQRANWDARVRESLAECLLRQGETEEAQKWKNEAADIRAKNPPEKRFGSTISDEPKKTEESLSESDPAFWKNRAEFFQTRGEMDKAEEALRKGLELAPPAIPPKEDSRGKGKHQQDIRSELLTRYVVFLRNQKRVPDAVSSLRSEMEKMPITAYSTLHAVNLLTGWQFSDQIKADDPVLWHWLERRTEWQHWEQGLLFIMLRSYKFDDNWRRYEVLEAAEKLAVGKDPSRCLIVGEMAMSMNLPKRAIPFFQEARDRSQKEELTKTAISKLLNACAGSGDWKAVQSIFPDVQNQPSICSGPLAVTAAKGGAKAEALLIWSHCAKADPSKLDALPDLAKAGLRDELISFYTGLQKEMPTSDIPAKALEKLKAAPEK